LITFWYGLGFGFLVILILITLGVQATREKKKVRSDEKAIGIVESEIKKDGYDHFELESITSLDKPNITTVIVNLGFMQISMEIDNTTGRILNKEKIAR